MNDHQHNNFNDSHEEHETNVSDLKSVVKLFFVSLFYMILVSIITYIIINSFQDLIPPLLKSFINLLCYSISLLLIIKYATGAPPQHQLLRIARGTGRNLIWLTPVLIISTLALCIGIEGVSLLMPMPEAVEEFFEEMIKPDVFTIINIVIVAPILEEVLCRGIILKGLLKNYSRDNAIGISAIFFAAMHMNPWQALPALLAGIFLGWVFYRTQSVLPGIIIHVTVNGTAVLLPLFFQDQQNLVEILGIPNYILACIFSAVVFVAGCVIIKKKTVVV